MFGLKKLFGTNKDSQSQSHASAKGKKKDGKFFMELDEAVDSATSALDSAVGSVTSTVSKVAEEIKAGASEAKEQPAPSQAKKQPAPKPKEKPATFEEKQNAPAKVTATKRQQAKSPAAPASVLQEKIPTSVEPVKAEGSNGKGEGIEAVTFAPKYLSPTTTQPRRRPGPSLEMFKDMARQVKTK